VRTFGRLLGFLRPYKRGVVVSLVLAALAMVCTVAIPWLTGQAVNKITAHDHAGLKELAAGVLGVALLRLVFSVQRRLVAGRVSLAIEFDLRNLLYAHLQRLELGFFASQQTGQLMSRATVDLSSVRFFLGYGLVFVMQSGLTIVLGATAMFLLQPGLAALSLVPVPFVVVIAARYGRRSRPALQEVQQRIAEVTADVEENISGVRVVKAFAAEDRQLERFRGSVARVFGQSMYATRLQAFYNPFLAFLPNLGLAVILLAVAGRLHRVLHLPADADRADAPARRVARAGPAGHGVGRPPAGDPRPRAADRGAAGSARAAGRPRRRCPARRDVRLRRRRAVAGRRVAGRRGGHHRGAGGRDRLGQDDARAAAASFV
jgi:ATP-binding cassette subfamily B protein